MRIGRLTTSLLGVGFLVLCGCTSPVELAFTESPVKASARSKAVSKTRHTLTFSPTIDLRPEYQRATVGHVAGREVLAGDLLGWIDRALGNLQGNNFITKPDVTPNSWRVIPRLRQFYTASLAVSKNANVVLELEFQPPIGPAFSRVYRGRVNSINWWNSAGEIQGSVVSSLGNCLASIARDVDAVVQTNHEPTL